MSRRFYKKKFIVFWVVFFAFQALSSPISCKGLFSLLKPSSKVNFSVFDGYPRDSAVVGGQLHYPLNWSYRKLGGLLEDVQEGEGFKGLMALTYLSTDVGGKKLVLKIFEEESWLRDDLQGYEYIRRALRGLDTNFSVVEVVQSTRNPLVLEIQYFEGIDMETFVKINPPEVVLPFIRSYNEGVAQIEAKLLGQGIEPKQVTPRDVIDEINLQMPSSGHFINIKPDNVLVVRDRSHPLRFKFLIVDPE